MLQTTFFNVSLNVSLVLKRMHSRLPARTWTVSSSSPSHSLMATSHWWWTLRLRDSKDSYFPTVTQSTFWYLNNSHWKTLCLQAFIWWLLEEGIPWSTSEMVLCMFALLDLCALGFLLIFSSPAPLGSSGEWFV